MIDEAALEAALDARVQRRLATDRRYRNAENAEEQAAAEHRIELEEELGLLEQANRDRMSSDREPSFVIAARCFAIRDELASLDELAAIDAETIGDPLAGVASVKA